MAGGIFTKVYPEELNEEHIARHFNVMAQCNQGKDGLPNQLGKYCC